MSDDFITVEPVYKALLEKPRIFGIGEPAFYGILIFTVLLMSTVSIYCIGIGILCLIICRILCKKEPYMIDFLVKDITQQDFYEG